jgi:GTPase SAR1 family protein
MLQEWQPNQGKFHFDLGAAQLKQQKRLDIVQGQKRLSELIDSYDDSTDWNEATTRFKFLDVLLEDCLGWDRQSEICVEEQLNGTFADYILGKPRMLILEAKRDGAHFEIPAGTTKKLRCSLGALMALSKPLKSAITQVQAYCAQRGVLFAAVSNGKQLIAFIGTKLGSSPFDGDAFVIEDLASLKANFAQVWQLLSPEGVHENKLRNFLAPEADQVPRKLLSRIPNPTEFRYKSDLQSNLRTLGELLLEDIPHSEETESKFLQECYVSSADLDRYSLLSKRTMSSRYTQFVREHAGTAQELDVTQGISTKGRAAPEIKSEILADAQSKRPIILLGDVGVGKTTFLRNLLLREAKSEFSNSIYVYIDLGSNASLSADIRPFIIDQIDIQLRDRYKIDIHEHGLVRGIYDQDVKRFRSSIYADLYNSDRPKYEDQLLKIFEGKLSNPSEHIRQAVRHLALARKKQVVFILDNCDQRTFQVQQDAFTVAQDMSENWHALVFLTLRPQTFYQSKLVGVMSAYASRILTVSPPQIDQVLNKRIGFAIKLAQGEISSPTLTNIKMSLTQITQFLTATLRSVRNENELKAFLSNISGGNVRSIVELITKFCGSPNVDARKIIKLEEERGQYKIPLHEFTKHALLGEYSYFNPNSSTVAVNLFDVLHSDVREHFLASLILCYLDFAGPHRDKDSFVQLDEVNKEMQNCGYTPQQIQWHFRRLAARNLVEAIERISLQAEEEMEGLALSNKYRITSIGTYHIRVWITTFSYLDAVSIDTPIFDTDLFEILESKLASHDIGDRLVRATRFRSYLSDKWEAAGITRSYFDWPKLVTINDTQFQKVKAVVDRE